MSRARFFLALHQNFRRAIENLRAPGAGASLHFKNAAFAASTGHSHLLEWKMEKCR